jgi:hypothetical protein
METITPTQFIQTIFENVPEGETPIFGTIDPSGDQQPKWLRPTDRTVARTKKQLYFCVATVEDQTPLRRRKVDFRAAYVAVCDDIGTKIDAAKLTVPPSYKLETSPGNYQWGYLLEPETDPDKFEALMKALADSERTDKACVDRTRIMRVPGSLNYKTTPPFAAVLHEWHPERVWSVDGLAEAYGLTLNIERSEAVVSGERVAADPVLNWLHERGDVLLDKGEWVDITCPWHESHEKDPRKEAGYRPLDSKGTRGFKCQHTSCAKHGTSDLMRWVGEQGGPGTVDPEKVLAKLADVLVEQKVPPVTVADVPPPQQSAYHQWRGTFPRVVREHLPDKDMGQKALKQVQPTTQANVRFISERLGITPRYNLMKKEYTLDVGSHAEHPFYKALSSETERRNAADGVLGDTMMMLGMRVESQRMKELGRLALHHSFHPFEDWLKSLPPMKGEKNIERLVATITLSEPEEDAKRARAYIRRWLIQCVEAACGWRRGERQLSGVLTFVGKQGIYKTTWFRSIVPPGYYKEGVSLHLNGHGARDSVYEALSGGLLVELGELETTFKGSEQGTLKNFISRSTDTLRMPYGSTWEEWPRMTAFCATVNSTSFLRDATGSRRFWPLAVDALDTRHGIDLAALWGEVYALWRAGEQWHLTGEEDALRRAQAEDFEDDSPTIETLKDWIQGWLDAPADAPAYLVTTSDLCKALSLQPADKKAASEVRQIAENLLGKRKKVEGMRGRWVIREGRKGTSGTSALSAVLHGCPLASAETVARQRWKQ